MSGLLNLKGLVSRTNRLEHDDVLKMKRALGALNLYEIPESYGLTEYSDDAMFAGLEQFQKQNGLQVDGLTRPDGETAKAMDQALSRRGVTAKRLAAPLKPPRTGPIPVEMDHQTVASNRRWVDSLMDKTEFGHMPEFLAEAWNKHDEGKVEVVDLIGQMARRDEKHAAKLKGAFLDLIPNEDILAVNDLYIRRKRLEDTRLAARSRFRSPKSR